MLSSLARSTLNGTYSMGPSRVTRSCATNNTTPRPQQQHKPAISAQLQPRYPAKTRRPYTALAQCRSPLGTSFVALFEVSLSRRLVCGFAGGWIIKLALNPRQHTACRCKTPTWLYTDSTCRQLLNLWRASPCTALPCMTTTNGHSIH
jgi:hypothetical protein